MFIDKKGKLGGKVSIIDILILVIILAVIVGIGVRYGTKITGAVTSEKEFEYVIKIDGIRDYTVKALDKKGRVTDKRSEKNIGEILEVVTENGTKESVLADGTVKYADYPGYYTSYVKVKATGKESDDNYVLDDATELSVGRTVDFYSKYVKTSGVIMSVEVIK